MIQIFLQIGSDLNTQNAAEMEKIERMLGIAMQQGINEVFCDFIFIYFLINILADPLPYDGRFSFNARAFDDGRT